MFLAATNLASDLEFVWHGSIHFEYLLINLFNAPEPSSCYISSGLVLHLQDSILNMHAYGDTH